MGPALAVESQTSPRAAPLPWEGPLGPWDPVLGLREGCGQVERCALPGRSVKMAGRRLDALGKEVRTLTLALPGLGGPRGGQRQEAHTSKAEVSRDVT